MPTVARQLEIEPRNRPAVAVLRVGFLVLVSLCLSPRSSGQSPWTPVEASITQETSTSQQAPSPPDSGESPQSKDGASDPVQTIFPHFKDTRFWLSGQANFIFQTHPPFHADYSGKNSLDPNYEKATSRVMTLYTGVRLNNSTEILVDIEEAGGAALSTGLGLAGFTNLDIVRNPSLSKAPYLARAMIHKVFAFSNDKVENERNALSLFEELPRR